MQLLGIALGLLQSTGLQLSEGQPNSHRASLLQGLQAAPTNLWVRQGDWETSRGGRGTVDYCRILAQIILFYLLGQLALGEAPVSLPIKVVCCFALMEQVAKKNFVSTYTLLARDNFETNENTEEEKRNDFLEATSIQYMFGVRSRKWHAVLLQSF